MRADLVEAIYVHIEEISQVVVHVEDLGVLKNVVVIRIEDVDECAADVGVETGESLFEFIFVEEFVVVLVELGELIADESGCEFREEARISPVAEVHHVLIDSLAIGALAERPGDFFVPLSVPRREEALRVVRSSAVHPKIAFGDLIEFGHVRIVVK